MLGRHKLNAHGIGGAKEKVSKPERERSQELKEEAVTRGEARYQPAREVFSPPGSFESVWMSKVCRVSLPVQRAVGVGPDGLAIDSRIPM